MTEADQFLLEILEHGDIIGRDAAGRTVIALAGDDAALDALLSFGAEMAESEDDEEPSEVPPVHPCWLEAA